MTKNGATLAQTATKEKVPLPIVKPNPVAKIGKGSHSSTPSSSTPSAGSRKLLHNDTPPYCYNEDKEEEENK